MSDLFSNPRFVTFRQKLEAKGITLKLLWSVKTGCMNVDGKKFKYDDLGFFACNGKDRPRVGTVIVKDYGEKGGFGLWIEPNTVDMDEDVKLIAGFEYVHGELGDQGIHRVLADADASPHLTAALQPPWTKR